MKTSNQIREEIKAQQAVVKAIVDLATNENREINAEEQETVDAAQEILPKLQASLENTLKIEALVAQNFNTENLDRRAKPKSSGKIVVPARARVHGALQGFRGPTAEKDAYVFGRWVAANFFGHNKSKSWLKDNGIKVRNAMSESEDDRGGLFTPLETTTTIIRLVEEFGVFRRYAGTEAMGSDRKVVPVRVSGLTATPVAETNRINEGSNTTTAQDIIYTPIELVARKWKVVVKISDELNEDSLVSLGDQVAVEAATAFAYAEDNAGFNGDGTSAYHGITGVLNAVAAGSVYTAATGNTAFATLDVDDFIGMKGKLPRFPGMRPAWFISQEGYCASIERLLMAAGGNTASNLEQGGMPMFLGAPVVITNVLNATLTAQTSTKILAYGDLAMAAKFGDRRRMTMSLSDQRYWDEDQIGIKATERFDINVHSKGSASAPGAILVMSTPGS